MMLRHLWATVRGLACRQQPEEIRYPIEFEAQYGVRLPDDMRAHYSTTNGMAEMDGDGFRIWKLAELRPLSVRHPDSARYAENPEQMFVFADYLSWCWAYAISLAPNSDHGRVFMVGLGGPNQLVADSFEGFVALVEEDSPRLYG